MNEIECWQISIGLCAIIVLIGSVWTVIGVGTPIITGIYVMFCGCVEMVACCVCYYDAQMD